MLALLRTPLLAAPRAAAAARPAAAARAFSASARASDVLLFVEHKAGAVNAASLSALTAARKLNAGDVHALIGGKEADVQGVADTVAKFDGVAKVLHASGEALGSSLAEAFAPLLKQVASSGSYTHVVAGHTALGRDVVPRAAALLDASQISDIIAVHDADTFERPIYAGNAIAKVKSSDKLKVLTVRGTAFDKAATEGGSASAEKVEFAEPSISTRLVSEQISKSSRPELATAARVVSGGRALKSAEGFEKYIEPLADALNAAVGASRAAVDAGYAANNLQVGQTGVVVAPELYLAVGISGAIQHLAGMKEAKTIVSINKDPECPMAEIADFALVANLEDAVPELLEKLKSA